MDRSAVAPSVAAQTAPPRPEPMIVVEGLTRSFRVDRGSGVAALRGVSLQVGRGEFYTLLGPSGCGKTTLLRCLAGLERPDGGTIVVDGNVYSAPRVHVPPYKRGIGMVFQNYAVWPHMTVFDNVAYPLTVGQGQASRAVRDQVMQALDRVDLNAQAMRSAATLSGGQQQRVAVARALIGGPKVMLLDEPLSNLDAPLRARMRRELRDLAKAIGITALYVTHDHVEALTMADRIGVIQDGVLLQEGVNVDVYQRPVSEAVARSLGACTVIRGTLATAARAGGLAMVDTPLGPLVGVAASAVDAGPVALIVRPEDVRVLALEVDAPSEQNRVAGVVQRAMFVGSHSEVTVEAGPLLITGHRPPRAVTEPGNAVHVVFEADAATVVSATPA